MTAELMRRDRTTIDVLWAKDWRVPASWQYQRVIGPCTTVWYVTKGTLAYGRTESPHFLTSGMIALLPAEGVRAVWNAGDGPLNYLSLGCYISVDGYDLFAFQEPVVRHGGVQPQLTECWTSVVRLYAKELQPLPTVKRLYRTGLVRILWSYILECLELDPLQEIRRLDPRVRTVIDMVNGNLEAPLSAAEIAQALHVSQSHLRRLLNDTLQMSYRQLLLHLRMRRAKQLLVEGELSVEEVASAVGYRERRHFSRAFSKAEGISPVRYAKGVAHI